MTTYYIANDGSDSNDGLSTGQPWLTFNASFKKLSAGDVLEVRGGTYTDGWATLESPDVASGTAQARILVRAYQAETPIIKGSGCGLWKDVHYWTFSGLTIGKNQGFQIGEWGVNASACTNMRWENCDFVNLNASALQWRRNCHGMVVDGCTFDNIRTHQNDGGNAHGIKCDAVGFTVTNSQFTDIGSDGMQIGQNDEIGNQDMLVEGCVFKVNRPYTYRNPENYPSIGAGLLNQVGENGIDCKGTGNTAVLTVRACEFTGFRPTDGTGDSSGSTGVACKYNVVGGADDMVVERCHFHDNYNHITSNNDRPGVVIRHNLFEDVSDSENTQPRGDAALTHLAMSDPDGGYRVENNTFRQVDGAAKYSIMELAGTIRNLSFKNNILWGSKIVEDGTSYENVSARNNCYYQIAGVPAPLQSVQDVNADPQLDGGYRPAVLSPVVDAGDNTLGWMEDYYGTAIQGDGLNIGAVEEAGASGVNRYHYKMDEGAGDDIVNIDPDTGSAANGTFTGGVWENIPANSRYYPMDDGPDGNGTIRDVLGGHDGTIINHNPDGWGQ